MSLLTIWNFIVIQEKKDSGCLHHQLFWDMVGPAIECYSWRFWSASESLHPDITIFTCGLFKVEYDTREESFFSAIGRNNANAWLWQTALHQKLVFSAVIISFHSVPLQKGKLASLLLDCIKTEMKIGGVIWEGMESNSLCQRSGPEAPGKWRISQQ